LSCLPLGKEPGGGIQEPDHWPPNPKLGGLEGIEKIFTEELPGYPITLYNIYNDIYADAPSFDTKWLNKDPDGSSTFGGHRQGGLCYIICSSQYRNLSSKHYEGYKKHLNLRCMYYDNYHHLKECYDHHHPQTKSEDPESKSAFVDWTIEKGMVTGTE